MIPQRADCHSSTSEARPWAFAHAVTSLMLALPQPISANRAVVTLESNTAHVPGLVDIVSFSQLQLVQVHSIPSLVCILSNRAKPG